MTGLLMLLLSGIVSYTGYDLTGYIQEQVIIENYFNYVESFEPIVYSSSRTLGQTTTESNQTNRSDCGGLIIGYMINLGLIQTRLFDNDMKPIFKDWTYLNSRRLYELGTPKEESQVKRGDFMYVDFSGGIRHIAVVCGDDPHYIYDLFKSTDVTCRYLDVPGMKYASNGVVEFVKQKNIILPETQEILDILNTPTIETNTGTNIITLIINRVKEII